jgi:hypothetical protein
MRTTIIAGCGGFSRLGLPAGKTEDEAVHLVHRFDEIDHMGGIHFC